MNVTRLQLGTEQYRQGQGIAGETGQTAAALGKRALVVAGQRAWAATADAIVDSLYAASVAFELFSFSGYCSERNVKAIIHAAKKFGAETVIGVGGGKCMDAVKSAADMAGLSCVLVPTSSATCAAHAKLCVWYTDEGVCAPGLMAKRSADAILVDTAVIGRAPARLLASGMADAIAKFPELDYSLRLAKPQEKTATLENAVVIARNNIEMMLADGAKAMREVQQEQPGFATNKMVMVSLGMTGLTSNLVAGVHQLAVAHMFHDGVASLYHDARVKYLHGEVVAVGIMLQIASNHYDAAFVEEVRGFLTEIGAPTCLSQLDIEPNSVNRDILFNYVISRGFDQPEMKEAIFAAFDTIMK